MAQDSSIATATEEKEGVWASQNGRQKGDECHLLYCVLVANGKHCRVVWVHQVLYTTGFRNGSKLSGTKRSLLVEGEGIPIGLVVGGATRHDKKLAEAALQSIVTDRPEPTIESPQNICLDKAYDFPRV